MLLLCMWHDIRFVKRIKIGVETKSVYEAPALVAQDRINWKAVAAEVGFFFIF